MAELFLRTVTVSLAVSLLLLPLLFLRGWLEKRYAPQTRWVVWLGVAAVLLIAPLLPRMTAPVQVEVPARTVAYTQVGTAALAAVPAPAPAVNDPVITPNQPIQPGMGGAAAPAPVTYRSVDWTELAAALWLAVAGVLLIVQTVRYGVTRRRLFRASRPVENREGEVELRVLMGLETPIAMGFFRPVVFLPAEETDPMALRHELKHIQRRDTWGKAFLFLACALHWFNPLVWRMARWADRDVEACCDAAVVGEQDTAYKRAYGELLLASAAGERSLPFATRFGGGKEQMKSRLAQLFRPGKRSRVLVCALLAAAVLLSGLVACTQQPPAEAAEPADGVYCTRFDTMDMTTWPVMEVDDQETDFGSVSLSLWAYDETGPQEDLLGEYTLPLSEDLTLWWYDGEEREIYGERGSFEWKRSVSDFLRWPMLRSSIPLGDDYLVVTVNDGEITRLSWALVDREGVTLAQVLAGEVPFIDFDTGEAQYVNALPDSDGVPVTVCRYAEVDMDGDTIPELVLWLQRGEDEYQLGSIVLHYEDGLVRGYSNGFRSMNLLTLKTDGTYHWSAGASDNGWGRMGFVGCEDTREISWEGQEDKDNVVWYDFMTGEPLTRAEDLTYHAASPAFLNSMGCTDHDCTDPTHYHHCSEDCADPAHYHDCPEGCSDTGHHHPAAHHSEAPVQPTVTHHPESHSGHHG